MPIAGSEGRHLYTSPDGSTFTFGLVKSDAGAQTLPRARIRTVAGLRSLSDPNDVSDPIVGSFGEVPRTSHRAGKTVTYTGVIEALSLADFETVADAMRQAMADESQDGLMTVSWHPLYSAGGTVKVYPARAMGLEIGDPIETTDRVSGTFVAAFRNHDGRYFEATETSVSLDLATTGGIHAWPSATFPATMQGPVLDVVSNGITNPSGKTNTTGWSAKGTHTTTLDRHDLPDGIASPSFDPPSVTALHAITSASGVAGDGISWSAPVTNTAPVTFIAWVFNRTPSAANLALVVRDAGGTSKGTSAVITPGTGWTKLTVTVTPNATATWTFNIEQQAAGSCEFYWISARLVRCRAMELEPGFGPRTTFPATWEAPDLHFDFEHLSILDDAGHDWSSLISPAFGIWSRNPFSAGSYGATAGVVTTGAATDPDVTMTLRWTKGYW